MKITKKFLAALVAMIVALAIMPVSMVHAAMPPFMAAPPVDAEIVEGDEVILVTFGVSLDAGSISYQWFECDDAVGTNPRPITGVLVTDPYPCIHRFSSTTIGVYYYYGVITNTAIDLTTATTRTNIVRWEVQPRAETPVISNPAALTEVIVGENVPKFPSG